jgi:uncharacterized protein Yka (UPF0111/DUF47 family)
MSDLTKRLRTLTRPELYREIRKQEDRIDELEAELRKALAELEDHDPTMAGEYLRRALGDNDE